MQPTGTIDALGIEAINNLNGVFSQLKMGERLALIALDSGFDPYIASTSIDLGALSGEQHAVSYAVTGTLSSGDSLVGLNMAVTTAGTAGSWVSGIYAKVTQGTTKNVNGYISGAEFEVINTAANVSDWFVLVLNANSSYNGSHSSYMALRDYGGTALNSMFWFGDQSIGSGSDTTLLTSVSGQTHSHAMRFIISGTPYWVQCTNIAPSTGYINHKTVWTIPAAAISGEEHGLSVSYTGTLSSGDSLVGVNVAVTTAGTAGSWVSGIYAKVTQGSTKNVNGYISGAEFEVINTAANVSDWFVLVLNANSSYNGSHSAFIALRDYGALELSNLIWAPEATIGTNSDTVLITTPHADHACSHQIKCIFGTTTLWLMATDQLPSA